MTLPDPATQPEFYTDIPWKRSMAWAVDVVVTLCLTLVALIATALLTAFILPLLFAAVGIGYRTFMLSRYGATLGMMLMAIKWRSLNGARPDTMTALIYSAAHAGMWTIFPLQIASIVTILLSPYRQGLHDMVLGTTMLHKYAPN
jgi:uncharacterized RDD family membrane protein YckC